jgi:hypothetical protein
MIYGGREHRHSNISLPAPTPKAVTLDINPRRSRWLLKEEDLGTLFSSPNIQRRGVE